MGYRSDVGLALSQAGAIRLQEKLNAAVSVREEAASRVDALIGRIQSVLPMAEEQQNG